MTSVTQTAKELEKWSQLAKNDLDNFLSAFDEQDAVSSGYLRRFALELRDCGDNTSPEVYTAIVFFLMTGCREMKSTLNAETWERAIRAALRLRNQLPQTTLTGLSTETAIEAAKRLLEDFIRLSGVAGDETVQNDDNRRQTLGYAVSWVMRYLFLYALEQEDDLDQSDAKDLAWITAIAKACEQPGD